MIIAIRNFWLKYKIPVSAALAVVFLVVLFLAVKTNVFEDTYIKIFTKTEKNTNPAPQNKGLVYGDLKVIDLVNKDTDGDTVPDWEESLYGLDPTKKETTPGTPDKTVVDKIKIEKGIDPTDNENAENLTKTDKFSRELFATVTAMSQNGAVDDKSIDQISTSLVDNIKNTPQRKIYLLSDLNVIKDTSPKAIKSYISNLSDLDKKYSIKQIEILKILDKFSTDENNTNIAALTELDPILIRAQKQIEAALKTPTPETLASLHLELLNNTEKIIENLNDIKSYEIDPIIALGAISSYDKNIKLLEKTTLKLQIKLTEILNN